MNSADLIEELAKNPDDFVAHYLLGCQFKKVEAIEEHFRKSIQLLPKRPAWMSNHFANGFIASWTARKGEEIVKGAFKSRSVKDQPFDVHHKKIYVMLVQGEYERAEKYYDKYLLFKGSGIHPFEMSKMSFSEIGRHNIQAAREHRMRLRLDPFNECLLKLTHAPILVACNRDIDVVALTNQLTRESLAITGGLRDLFVTSVVLCRGLLQIQQQNLQDAAAHLNELLKLTDPRRVKLPSQYAVQYIWSHLGVSLIALLSGDFDGCIQHSQALLKNITELAKDRFSSKLICARPFVNCMIGLAEFDKGKDKSAMKYFTEAIKDEGLIPTDYWPM
ncbi:MAG: hypothetical protein ACFFAD_08670 [Candidatus Hermodarchaeota archaeon]